MGAQFNQLNQGFGSMGTTSFGNGHNQMNHGSNLGFNSGAGFGQNGHQGFGSGMGAGFNGNMGVNNGVAGNAGMNSNFGNNLGGFSSNSQPAGQKKLITFNTADNDIDQFGDFQQAKPKDPVLFR